jgi:hypothetical protein
MRLAFKSFALVLCLLAPLPGLSQDDREARLVAAREYVTRSVADRGVTDIIEQMWQPMVPTLESTSGKTLTEDQLARIDALYQEAFGSKLLELMLAQDEVMADLMTLSEIEALRNFYATELGRSVMLKLPKILADQQPQIMAMVQSTMPEITTELLAIVAGQ